MKLPSSEIPAEQIYNVITQWIPTVNLVLIGIFIIVGIILNYHWKKYSLDTDNTWLWQFIYFSVGFALAAFMIVAEYKMLA